MSGIFKSRTHWLLGLFVVVLMLFWAFAPGIVGAQARPKGAPAALKVGFVDFFSGAAATFGGPGKAQNCMIANEKRKYLDDFPGVPFGFHL